MRAEHSKSMIFRRILLLNIIMKKRLIPSLIFLCFVSLLIPDFAFAQTNESDWNMYEIIDQFVKFFAWFWVIPATVAGKLMTNEFAFGEIIWLNTYLRDIRIIMRNFANFLIGWIFLYFIFKTIYDGSIRASLQRIFKLLVAAVLVNMSRFLMTVLVDISTVATAAVSSLPVQVLQKTRERDQTNKISICPEYNVTQWAIDGVTNNACWGKELVTFSLDSVLPHADNMSGPILYMWVWLLWFLSSDFISVDQTKIETIALTGLIKILVLIMFVVPVLLLVITNMIRIFWIWIWIIFSPFIILDMALGSDSPIKKLREDGLLRTGEHIWNMLGLIFLPTIIVWLMGIWLVLMSNIMWVIAGTTTSDERWITLEQLQISGNPAKIEAWPVNTTITWSVFDNAKTRTLWFFGEIILAFMSIFIFRWILKVWFWFSNITKWLTNKAFELWWWLAKSLPIVPMFWWQSINSLSHNAGEKVKRVTWLKKLEQNARLQSSEMLSKFGMWGGLLNKIKDSDMIDLESAVTTDKSVKARAWVKNKLPEKWVGYTWDIQELTRKWFGNRTVSDLRNEMRNQSLFGQINKVWDTAVWDMTLSDLESNNNGAQLAWFIQWLIEQKSWTALANASNNNSTQLASAVFR